MEINTPLISNPNEVNEKENFRIDFFFFFSNCHLRKTQKINGKNSRKFFRKIRRNRTYKYKRRVEGSP